MNQDTKFRGGQTYRIDAKGRISVPPKWRDELGKEFAMMEATHCGQPVLKVLPMETVDAKTVMIRSDETLEPGVADYLIGEINERITDGTLNEQGKLLVPKVTAEGILQLSLPGPVHLMGRGDHFIIINPEHLPKAKAEQPEGAVAAKARYGI